jgi:hypothetical protein
MQQHEPTAAPKHQQKPDTQPASEKTRNHSSSKHTISRISNPLVEQARTFRNTIHEPKPRHPLNTIDYIRLNSHLIIENTITYRLPNHPHKSKPNDQKTFPPFFISTITNKDHIR